MKRETQLRSKAKENAPSATAAEQGITEDRYASLTEALRLIRAKMVPGDPDATEMAEPTLLLEARLLDDRRYRDWLKILSAGYVYWIPSSEQLDDPRLESAVNFDDYRRMVDRITLIETGALHAQIPPSRVCRVVSNIEAWSSGEQCLLVRSNLVIWEYRRGTATAFAGSQVHELVGTAGCWAIKTRIINLINCDEPQGNVTFIL